MRVPAPFLVVLALAASCRTAPRVSPPVPTEPSSALRAELWDGALVLSTAGKPTLQRLTPRLFLEGKAVEARLRPPRDGNPLRFPLERSESGAALPGALEVRSFPGLSALVVSLDWEGEALGAEPSVELSLELPDFARGKALHQWKPHWTAPVYVQRAEDLPAENPVLFWQQSGSATYHALLPLVGSDTVATFSATHGALKVSARIGASGRRARRIPLFAYAVSPAPYPLPERLLQAGLTATNKPFIPRSARKLPAEYERLGYCTWEALHADDLSQQSVVDTIARYSKLGVPIHYVIVDDGWAKYREKRLASLEANPSKFPDGLEGLSQALRPYGVQALGVWLTLEGHWEGVDRAAGLGTEETLLEVAKGRFVPHPEDDRGFRFWKPHFDAFARSGVRLLKIDNQARFGREFLKDTLPIAHAGKATLQVETAAQQAGLDVLNCMALAPELIQSWQQSAVARSSDDYLPDNPEQTKKLQVHNVENAFFLSALVTPDWDMFQSHDRYASYHVLTRAMSRQPIYVSDRADRIQPAVLKPLLLADGRLLLPDTPALPTEDIFFRDLNREPSPQKVFSTVRRPGYSAALLGAFNVTQGAPRVEGRVRLEDVHGLEPEGASRFALYRRGTGELHVLERNGTGIPVVLEEFGADIFTVTPVEQGVAVLGLLDKYVGPAAVRRVQRGAGAVELELEEGGELGLYLTRPPKRMQVNGRLISPTDSPGAPGLVRLKEPLFSGEGPQTVRIEWE